MKEKSLNERVEKLEEDKEIYTSDNLVLKGVEYREKMNKIIHTIEITKYWSECSICKKKIYGYNPKEVEFNLVVHKNSNKRCQKLWKSVREQD